MKIVFLTFVFTLLMTSTAYAEEPVAGITVPIENLQQSQTAIKRDVPIPFIY